MATEMKLVILEEMNKRRDGSQPPLEHRSPSSEHRPPPSEHRPPEHNELWCKHQCGILGNFYVKAIYRIIFV